jgi:hypothetical protein
LDKAYGDKRRILREYSIKDEIRDLYQLLQMSVLFIMMIVIFVHQKHCLINTQEVHDKFQEYFEKYIISMDFLTV